MFILDAIAGSIFVSKNLCQYDSKRLFRFQDVDIFVGIVVATYEWFHSSNMKLLEAYAPNSFITVELEISGEYFHFTALGYGGWKLIA